MSDGFLHESLRGVDWGVATADTLAAPPPHPAEQAGHFRQWTDDIRHLTGVAADTHRMVAGWPQLQPDGPGSWDRAALDRCDRALDSSSRRARGRASPCSTAHCRLGWTRRAAGSPATPPSTSPRTPPNWAGASVTAWTAGSPPPTWPDPPSPTMWPECTHLAGESAARAWPPSITSCSPTPSPPRPSGPPARAAGSARRSRSSAATRPPTTPTTGSPWNAWRAGPTGSSSTPCCSASTW